MYIRDWIHLCLWSESAKRSSKPVSQVSSHTPLCPSPASYMICPLQLQLTYSEGYVTDLVHMYLFCYRFSLIHKHTPFFPRRGRQRLKGPFHRWLHNRSVFRVIYVYFSDVKVYILVTCIRDGMKLVQRYLRYCR